jgi:putative endopeptidase
MRARVLSASLFVAAACSGQSKAPTSSTTASTATPGSSGSLAATPATPGSSGSPAATPPAPPAPTKPVETVKLADVGLEPASLDRSVDPCVDFYEFACGGWEKATQIPQDRARWGRFSEIEERGKLATKTLLDDDLKAAASDPLAKKLGDFYASCMDTNAIEKAGLTSIKPLLDKTRNVKDVKSWQAAVIALHKAGIDVAFNIGSGPDFKESTKVVTQLDSGGLGLPDRDYYLKPEFKDKVTAYHDHVAKMLALGGTPEAKATAAADDVVAIETDLAGVTKTRVEARDPTASYNPTDAAALAKQVKSVDWKRYFQALDFTPSQKIISGTPKFLDALDDLVTKKYKPAQWSNYLTYHLLEDAAFGLPKAFDDEAFALKKALTGQPAQPERFKRCIDATSGSLGELLGQQYVAKYFPPAAKQTAVSLVDALVASLGNNLHGLDWMSDATKPLAEEKRTKIVRMVGYTDKWRVYNFDVKRGDFAGNQLRASSFEQHRQLAKSGKPVDRSEWLMNSYTVNAYYNPTANNTALPAGILQPPFFGPDRSIAANLGGIGMVIGHELTHGFDDQGAQFDSDGNLKNWWQESDKTKFDAKGKCVADQYSTFEAMPKGFVNGKLTLGENIADLGGVKLAFHAYRNLRKDAPKEQVADGFTEDQQFFLAVGQAWCSKDRPEEVQRRLTVDPHSPPKFRVYGSLRNLPEFAKAFSCAAGTPMNPAKSCQVWQRVSTGSRRTARRS